MFLRMMAKGGDKEAASIVTDGCNMGFKTICGYKNQYSGASKAVMEIADYIPADAPPPPEAPADMAAPPADAPVSTPVTCHT